MLHCSCKTKTQRVRTMTVLEMCWCYGLKAYIWIICISYVYLNTVIPFRILLLTCYFIQKDLEYVGIANKFPLFYFFINNFSMLSLHALVDQSLYSLIGQ